MQGGFRVRALRATVPMVYASILIALCLPLTAHAAEPQGPIAPELGLSWQAPAGCVSSADVENQFARLLGGPTRSSSGKHIAASATVRGSSSGRWTLELATVLDGAAGRRSLAGDSCASVASAAALILALMIDPAAADRAVAAADRAVAAADRAVAAAARAGAATEHSGAATELPAPPPSPTTPRTPPPPTVAATPPPPPTPPPVLRPFARSFAGVVVALLPTPAPAAGLAVGARRGRIGAELSVVVTEELRAAAAARAGAGGDFRLVAGGVRTCGQLGARVVDWQLCLGAELERLTGAGFGVDVLRSRTVTMLAGAAGLLVSLPLGSRLALSLDLDAAVRPYHPAFVLDGVGRVFQIPLLSGFAALGLIVTI
jgi:hypothetical protein